MIAANARTTTNLNARLSGSCAISASWHQVDERDFREGNRERCASCFTLAQKNAQVVGADLCALRQTGYFIGMPVFVPSRRKFLVYCAASWSLMFSRSRSVTSR